MTQARTQLEREADRRAAAIRRALAEDIRRLIEDAGVTQAAVARVAGVHPSVVSRLVAGEMDPTIRTYARVSAALGADFTARVYPQSGPHIRDRHQVRMGELVLASIASRWQPTPEVRVRRPVSGWMDLALHDAVARLVVATELESGLRRIEQLVRWSTDKADALPSSAHWERWLGRPPSEPTVSRLLVVRWTRANREAVAAARRLLREAYPADPQDALEALVGGATWPGPAIVWARIDRGDARLTSG